MSKKRKAAELAGAEPSQSKTAPLLDNNPVIAAPEPAEKVKKSKKRKTPDDVGAESVQQIDNNPPAVSSPDNPRKKSKKSKTDESDQPAKEEAATSRSIKTEQDPTSELTAGEKRQAKSERPRRNKKGKLIHTRDMALARNALVQVKKKERKERLKLARMVPAPTTTSSNPDPLATGSDFVPLFTEDTNPTPVNLDNDPAEPVKMIMLPKRSKKGLTKADRKAKAELNRVTQQARTAKRKEKKLRKLSVVNPDPLPENIDPSTLLPPPVIRKQATQPPTSSTNDQKPAHRFILFIGNLPFTTTTESLEKHFESLRPFTVRHSTDKFTKKSKGFCFLEFENYDKMKTCLSLYHHSYFNPEDAGGEPIVEDDAVADQRAAAQAINKTKDKGRRINVELTAGGGGKGKERKEKIQKKNQKLSEQRERKVQKEKLDKSKQDAKKPPPPPPPKIKSAVTGANAQTEIAGADTRGDIHPSRMNRVMA